jgi:hypothetical protein
MGDFMRCRDVACYVCAHKWNDGMMEKWNYGRMKGWNNGKMGFCLYFDDLRK